jgi:hypothetical protein
MTLEDYINALAEVAKEVEVGDPFDWADVALDETEAYKLIASSVVGFEDDPFVLKATITKLLVENMVLNVRLMQNAKT